MFTGSKVKRLHKSLKDWEYTLEAWEAQMMVGGKENKHQNFIVPSIYNVSGTGTQTNIKQAKCIINVTFFSFRRGMIYIEIQHVNKYSVLAPEHISVPWQTFMFGFNQVEILTSF